MRTCRPARARLQWAVDGRAALPPGDLGVGYADGLPVGAAASAGAGATWSTSATRPAPSSGRVSMDLTIDRHHGCCRPEAAPGATVELLGAAARRRRLGRRAGTIGYEILTNLGRRYRGATSARTRAVLPGVFSVPPADTMSKTRHTYVCQSCGAVTNRWQGRCDACGGWNTIVEEAAGSGIGAQAARKAAKGRLIAFQPGRRGRRAAAHADRASANSIASPGGGFVPGSVILLGGEPGIGKSTLLIQACAQLAAGGRARRLHIGRGGRRAGADAGRTARASGAPVELAAATNGRGHHGDAQRGQRRSPGRHRFDPDDVDGDDRGRAGHRVAGARRGPVPDPLCQEHRGLP